jgi:hypothetical protein
LRRFPNLTGRSFTLHGQGVVAGLAALSLLLAALARGALARLHLVHDEARVALFAVPFEALKVGVCELVVGLGRMNVSRVLSRISR